MADDIQGDAKTQDSKLLRELSEDEFIRHSKAQVVTLVDAIKQALGTLALTRTNDKYRLAKVETQTRLLARAVIALAGTSRALDPAVRAVKDEMPLERRRRLLP